jgi:DNA polymerase-3 subunit alpha
VWADGKTLQPGFAQIPGVGPATAGDIAAWREDNPGLITWPDLQAVAGIGPTTVKKFLMLAEESDPLGVNHTRDQLEIFRFQLQNGEFDGTGLPSAEEFIKAAELEAGDPAVCFVGLISNIVFRDEVETAYSRTGRPLAELRKELEEKYNGNTKKATIFAHDETGEVALRISAYTFPRFQTQLNGLDPDKHMVVAFGRTYDRNNAIQVRALWVLDLD